MTEAMQAGGKRSGGERKSRRKRENEEEPKIATHTQAVI